MSAAEERVVEEVARAMFLNEAEECGYLDTAAPAWDVADVGQAKYRRLAVAAVAAYRATQDGAVEAAFAELEQHRSDLLDDTHELSRGRALGVGEAIDVLRAALAAVDPS